MVYKDETWQIQNKKDQVNDLYNYNEVVLENWSPLIELSDDKKFKQVRFSPRLDFVPMLDLSLIHI